jgi:uncharacterized protein YjbI with pentapeptide repeats
MAKLTEQEQIAPDESTAVEGDGVEEVCPITMGNIGHLPGPRCGRKLHAAPDGVDEFRVCLMHSKDLNKQSAPPEPLFGEFWREFERILEEAGEGKAHFDYFVFPRFYFGTRIFKAICHFNSATFTQYSIFSEARFKQNVYFSRANFMQGAEFGNATFAQEADFSEATFAQARFADATFQGTANWQGSRFLDQAEFRSAKFDPQVEGAPSAVFALAKFSKPSEIVFDDVDLSRALFHNCDVSQVCFTSSVRWAQREGNHGLAVFEETIDLEQYARGLKRDGERDFRAVAQIYQQLKKNYDSRLDYWTGNEFHFGEMEMMRLAGLARCLQLKGKWMLRRHIQQQFTRLRQWCHPRLSFVALSLYKYASDYGNSYGKPLAWLLGVLLAWALLFPLPGLGLERSRPDWVETYGSVWRASSSWRQGVWWEFVLVMKSWVMAVDVATFQKNANYTPATAGAHAVAIVETLLISTLFGLFLLAVRRQFKR